MQLLTIGVLAGLSLVAPAQQTWVVDPNGGGHFTTVVPAIAAAAPGDTLWVRGGTYGESHYIDKSLHVVGDAALEPPTLNLLTILPGSGAQVSVVHVRVTMASIHGIAAFDDVTGLSCTVQGGTVALTRCDFFPEVRVNGGDVAINQCTLRGRAPFYWQTRICTNFPGTPGIAALGGTIDIANSMITGGDYGFQCGFSVAAPLPGISIDGAVVRATRSHISGGATFSGGASGPVGLLSGSFECDASTTFGGGLQPPGSQVFLPATDGTSAGPGSAITCRLDTRANLAAILVACLGMRARVMAAPGPLWVEPQGYVGLAFGLTGANGTLAASIPVPAIVQRGLAVAVQGGALDPNTSAPTAGTAVVLHVQ